MKIIEQSHEVLTIPEDLLEMIERCGRTCYQSESKGNPEKFVKMLLDREHHAMIEFGDIIVKFITNRGVTHELVRHRAGTSYAQECVAGSTKIKIGTKGKIRRIDELYRQKHEGACFDKLHAKTLRVKSVDDNGTIINNKIVDVFKKGKQEVFEVATALGYTIFCTANHRFLLPSGSYAKLSDLTQGSGVMVNGRTTHDCLPNVALIHAYLTKGFAPLEISTMYNVGYRTVVNRLKNLGIFEPRKNDKNPEKYTKNHTKSSYKKMVETINRQYQNGRKVWNKGLKESDHPSVMMQGDSLRAHHNDGAKKGSENPSWKGGIDRGTGHRKISREQCELCGGREKIEMHHIDKDPQNNKRENLKSLCVNCHKKHHFGWAIGKKIHEDKIVRIKSVGVQETYDIEMQAPYHNYIADGFVTHNSTRYVKYDGQMEFIKPVWVTTALPYTAAEWVWVEAMKRVEADYKTLLAEGWKAQQAREVLPNSLKTEIVVKANIREWMHILNLRCSPKAHPQMVALMSPLLEELHHRIPVLFDDLFDRYIGWK